MRRVLLVLLALAAGFGLGASRGGTDDRARLPTLRVDDTTPAPGQRLVLHSQGSPRLVRDTKSRLEARRAGRWVPVADLVNDRPRGGPFVQKPGPGERPYGGLGVGLEVPGKETVQLPERLAPGVYRIRKWYTLRDDEEGGPGIQEHPASVAIEVR